MKMRNNNIGKVLVTGGAGFIGSHLTDKLIQKHYEVTVLDNFSTGRLKNLENSSEKVKIIEGNMGDRDIVKAALQGVTVIHHLAAQPNVRRSVEDPIYDLQNNVEEFLVLLEEAIRHDVQKIIYASSGGAAYGEPFEIPVPESHPTNPISPYGISKLMVEKYLHYYQVNYGLTCLVLRYANVYGPRQDPLGEAGVMSIFFHRVFQKKSPQIFGDGTQTRDYIFVEDVVASHLAAMDYNGENWIFNIGTGHEVSVLDIVDVMRTVVGRDVQPEHIEPKRGEVYKIALDCRLAQRELNWKPQTNLHTGMQKLWEWIKTSS
ncbi:MAG: NAD-dependent epimerase/dehydratase family protein [Candidatus Heimdallarchaeota archaeon]